MKLKSEKIEVNINTLGYCSEGIGKAVNGEYAGMTVFVDNTTIGDSVIAEPYHLKKNYMKASLIEIVKEGESRVKPECPLAKVCGGCQWQHIDYKYQLEAKTQSVKDNIKKIAEFSDEIFKDTISSPEMWKYRAKVQLPLGRTKNSKRLLAGYYKQKSHEIVNMKYCPVQPADFDEIIAELRDLHKKYFLEIYNEKSLKGFLRHLILRKSFANNDILLTFVVNSKKIPDNLTKITESLTSKFPQIKGVTVNINTKNTNVILGEESKVIYGYDHITETIGNKSYQISDQSFFQINPYSTRIFFDKIYEIIKSRGNSKKLLDIYAGVSAISIYVNDLFEEIIAIENSRSAQKNSTENYKINKIENINFVNNDALDAVREINNIESFDWVILDPPRAGCEKDLLELLAEKVCGNIIYASCNPATLARDIKILMEYGFTPTLIQPIDMFCHTYHVETIVLLEKNG